MGDQPRARHSAAWTAWPLTNCRAANSMAASATASSPAEDTSAGPAAADWRPRKPLIVLSSPDVKKSLLDTPK